MANYLKPGLVVSCQALRDEPLYGGDTIVKMARAAVLGGAVGIRANTVRDIRRIRRCVEVPVVGLIKRCYPDSEIYITPTLREVRALLGTGCPVVAMDATDRPRPGGERLEDLVRYVRECGAGRELMADVSTIEEARRAEALGFDYVSSTLRSYTASTAGIGIPDMEFLAALRGEMTRAVPLAEGGIRSAAQLGEVLNLGYTTVIIGGAITRPMEITKYYVQVFQEAKA